MTLICRSVSLSALLFLGSIYSANASVVVEPTQTIIDSNQQLGGGRYLAYPLALDVGTTIYARISVSGGLDNTIQTWLVDLNNLQRLKANYQFDSLPEGSTRVVAEWHYAFTAPDTNVYYLVLDNRPAWFKRDLRLRVDRVLATTTDYSRQLSTTYASRYGTLRTLFKFRDFDIYIKPCGFANASSSPDILVCSELIEETQQAGVPEAEVFVFTHEVAHSLLFSWNYPGYDNEDTADEFATVLLVLLGKKDAALQAAQWWATRNSDQEIKEKPITDDRHSLSVQRARNILSWLDNNIDDRMRRWMHVMIPNMQDQTLSHLENDPAFKRRAPADVIDLVRYELEKRRRANVDQNAIAQFQHTVQSAQSLQHEPRDDSTILHILRDAFSSLMSWVIMGLSVCLIALLAGYAYWRGRRDKD